MVVAFSNRHKKKWTQESIVYAQQKSTSKKTKTPFRSEDQGIKRELSR